MNDKRLHDAARMLGSRGGKALKTITPQDRQRRRDWAKGLAALRKAKAPQVILSRFTVIDRRGARWPYSAESVQHAITLARLDGIDAVAGRAERGENRQ